MPADTQSRTAVARIQEMLEQAFEGGAWHGPALMELLQDIHVDHAAAKPIAHAHSIWEIALHIAAWQEAVLKRLNGEAVDLTGDQDWPPVSDNSERAWAETIQSLKNGHKKLVQKVSALTDADLPNKVPGRDHTTYYTLHGLIQHNLYHAGQIAILKKSER
ncbi:MAG TPA: DinB family protein [Terriglobales bacterium]|nr:DinB family protein [Terriglobales bacterium]